MIDKETVKANLKRKVKAHFGVDLANASIQQIYTSLGMIVRDEIMDRWIDERNDYSNTEKRLYYLSVEFLTGRALHNNMLNLLSLENYESALKELGISLEEVEEREPEPGLGNGGLGRLAACFMESLATLDFMATGMTIRYEYGLFRQLIANGNQMELPDNWLENGNVWEMRDNERAVEVHFGGQLREEWEGDKLTVHHVDYATVRAVPYDMPVVGYDGECVNTLRMFSAKSDKRIDMASFSRGEYSRAMEERELAEVISKVLYPDDNHTEGKELRLKQHYFLASASVQNILRDFKRTHGNNLYLLPDKVAIQINDTHPGFAIPELMRILIDEEGMEWEAAEGIARSTFAYTNHTVMAEALEHWDENLVKYLMPRVYQILEELNRRQCETLWESYPGQWERIAHMAIISYNKINMANLCIWLSHKVNGVSALHTEILKRDTFHDFYVIKSDEFVNVTNGITFRRWLMQANPELTELIMRAIGTKWVKEPEELQNLRKFAEDAAFIEKFKEIKHHKKVQFAHWMDLNQAVNVNPDTIFDVQAKRLHEYKRQLLNVLHILHLYNHIVSDDSFEIQPRTFFFAAKAAPGYARAKLIIKLMFAVKNLIKAHPRARQMLKVVFVTNYCVTAAEHMMPAAEVSEQISTAGKEASGTGNMKFMLNGALTIGTMDGANVEIAERVGMENIYIFGLRAEEVEYQYTHNYKASAIYERNPEIRRLLEQLIDGTLSPDNHGLFTDLYHSLLFGDHGGMADSYLLLADFDSYSEAHERINEEYGTTEWYKKAIINVAEAGYFSSDRSIRDYNAKIWHLKP